MRNCVLCGKPLEAGERFAHADCEAAELFDMARAQADVDAYDAAGPHPDEPPTTDLF